MDKIRITECSVQLIKSPAPPLLAFARVTLNGVFVVTGIRLVQGKSGIFVSWPREYNKAEGKGYNTAFPCEKATQEEFSAFILEAYRLEAEKTEHPEGSPA